MLLSLATAFVSFRLGPDVAVAGNRRQNKGQPKVVTYDMTDFSDVYVFIASPNSRRILHFYYSIIIYCSLFFLRLFYPSLHCDGAQREWHASPKIF